MYLTADVSLIGQWTEADIRRRQRRDYEKTKAIFVSKEVVNQVTAPGSLQLETSANITVLFH